MIVGHYWRSFSEVRAILPDKDSPDLFEGIEPHHWMGANSNVYCVDFSIGGAAVKRVNSDPLAECKLAALRVPEWEVFHHDGYRVNLVQPGKRQDTT